MVRSWMLAWGWGTLPQDGASWVRGFGELLLPRATTDRSPRQPPAPLSIPWQVDKVGSFPQTRHEGCHRITEW